MKTKKLTYQAPECVCIDVISEFVLCTSQEDGATIKDYDKIIIEDWD